MKKKITNYVDNIDFKTLLINYQELKKTKPNQIIPDSIGLIIMSIANNLVKRRNFCGYTFKDELVGDAIETCVKYLHNYDTNKSDNPFAYFTQICFYAFVRRIKRENQQYKTKRDLINNLDLLDDSELANFQNIDSNDVHQNLFLNDMRNYLREYNDHYEQCFAYSASSSNSSNIDYD